MDIQYARSLASASLLALGAASFIAYDADAASISYNVTNVAGNSWRYDYTVANSTLGAPLEELTIYFDHTLYRNLAVADSPVEWDSLVVQPDLALPDDGFFDSLALLTGIAPSVSLSGFSVSFNYIGQGVPGAQYFEVVNPTTFAVLESGTTAVPAPSAGALLATGIAFAAARRRRRMPPSAATLQRRLS